MQTCKFLKISLLRSPEEGESFMESSKILERINLTATNYFEKENIGNLDLDLGTGGFSLCLRH